MQEIQREKSKTRKKPHESGFTGGKQLKSSLMKLLYRREIAEVEPGGSGFAGRRHQKISLVLMAFEKEDSRTRA